MRQRSLRFRLLLTFGFGSLLLSSLFASITYIGVRHTLDFNEQQNDIHQAYSNAVLIRTTLYSDPSLLSSTLQEISKSTNSTVMVVVHGFVLGASSGVVMNDIPSALTAAVTHGLSANQTVLYQNQVSFIVGTPVPAASVQIYEIFSLDNLSQTLRTLLSLLTLGALLVTLIGYTGGVFITRRATRPLREVSEAAAAIAHGEFSTRLHVGRADLEVQELTESFNTMVEQLTERIERDTRFASDVSHELRSPLTTMATTAGVLQRHRDELSDVAQASLDLLIADVAIFQSLVEDLLEMARSDAGAIPLLLETVPVGELVKQSVRSGARRHGLHAPPVNLSPNFGDPLVSVDRRRFERVITNLIDNAHRYAGDATAVRLDASGDTVFINVDDAGDGIAPEERAMVFQRFFRGRAANDRGIARGTGLGLALVKDHVEAFGGTINIYESPEGGARFQIALPVVEAELM